MPDPSTTRLGLYKSKSDGSELVNYTQDIGQNWDRVDAAVGFQSCTSSTRPSSPYSGKPIMETDTNYRTYFSNGTSPASASWVEIPNSSSTYASNLTMSNSSVLTIGDANLYRAAADTLTTDDTFRIIRTSTGSNAISVRVTGDTNSRLLVNADGGLNWGPGGGSSVDVTLSRTAANTLSLASGDSLIVGGDLTVSGVGQSLFARKTADTSRSSTTTATDDPHLTVALSASATYTLIAYIVYQAGTSGDFNMQWSIPTGANGSWQGTGLGRDVAAAIGTGGWTVRMNTNDVGTTQARSYGGDTTNQAVQVMGVVRTSSAGTFALQWAQAVSDATATIVRTDSWMQLVRVA